LLSFFLTAFLLAPCCSSQLFEPTDSCVFDRVGSYDDSGTQPEDLLFFYKHLEHGGVLRKVLYMLSFAIFSIDPTTSSVQRALSIVYITGGKTIVSLSVQQHLSIVASPPYNTVECACGAFRESVGVTVAVAVLLDMGEW
jgi:hypothetical protein